MAMRLDVKLPEFLRIIWSSPEAQMVWEGRISRISAAWIQMERLAVRELIKPAALQVCSPEELPILTKWAMDNDLVCVPLSQQGVSDGYANGTSSFEPGRKWGYRVVIANPDLASLFIRLWKEQDDDRIGAALGFPQCCRDFFQKYWVSEGWRDLTLPMVLNHDREYFKAPGSRNISVGGSLECNILLRWLGLRLVSHLPCNFDCSTTTRIGERMGLLGLRNGYVAEMDWLTQILNWPIRWSSLHGVGIVTTPVFRLVFDSTALAEEWKIDRDGPTYPSEAARGNEFPFKNVSSLTVRRTNDYTDNGFGSREGMDAAHEVVITTVIAALSETLTETPRVMDLGCGNGLLLEKILNVAPHIHPCGVEMEVARHQRAARRLLSHNPDIRHGHLRDESVWTSPFDVAVIALNRITEVGPIESKALLERLRLNAEYVVIYSYEHTEWPGTKDVAINDYLHLQAHYSGNNSCAVLTRTRKVPA